MSVNESTSHSSGSFSNKAVFITGAAEGIGRAIAIAFAAEGANVAVSDLSVERLDETVRLVGEYGVRALPLRCDVRKSEDVTQAIDQTVAEFGKLDVAVNNAGIEQPGTLTADTTDEDWDRILETNLRGVFVCMKHEIRAMGSGGSIVNIGSGAAVVGIRQQAAYVAAKHGVIGLTKSAALEYAAQGIRINAVCPGIIETPMMDRFSGGTPEGRARVIAQEPVGRMGRPEEIASAVLWLSSDLGGLRHWARARRRRWPDGRILTAINARRSATAR